MNFSIFPKTTAGPSASEKPCGRMLSIFSFFRKRLPDQVLRKSFVGVLGSSWHLLGSLEALLEPPGALFGASWGALGEVLGPLGRLLGRLEGDPKKLKNSMQKSSQQGGHHKSFWAPQRGAKSIKNAAKTEQKLSRFSSSKKLLFKSLLEPSWADLGAFWKPSWGQK